MKFQELKQLMKAKNVGWTLPPDFADNADISSAVGAFATGAVEPPPGVLTARMPRMRAAQDNVFFPSVPGVPRMSRPTVGALPKAWDWRQVSGNNWLSPVRNQGGCGSCVAFAAAAALEVHRRIETNRPRDVVNVSEAGLFFIPERQCNPGDPRYGWHIPGALDFLLDQGICDEAQYPYSPVNQNAQLIDGNQLTLKITGYDSTSQVAQMKRWLCEEGPLITRFDVFEDFGVYWSGGATGVYSHVTGTNRGGHAVAVIGYDDTQSCWICRNSWGSTRGNDGCFRIAYGQCGIDARMYLIEDVHQVYTRDELTYNPRNLRIVNEGANGWLLTDGVSRMKMLDNAEDARNALRVARRHTRHGFVGRDNPRSNRIDYITEYWAGSSGLAYEPLTKVDAIAYQPARVIAEDIDSQGWRIRDGDNWMLLAHDLNDALAVLREVERHTRMCFIGRGNTRPNRKSYIMTYWE